MSKLSQHLVEQIMLEESTNRIEQTIVVYAGRFQPIHQGHFGVYQHLVKKFGKDNVFVVTSDKVELPKSPFNFKEKQKIITTMFPIPNDKLVQVKNPYNPKEVLEKFDKETTAFVTVVSDKDSNRLSRKYFKKYDGNPIEGYGTRGYLYVSPLFAGGVSGTDVRNGFATGTNDDKKEFFSKKIYTKFNKSVFDLITHKLGESIQIKKEIIEDWMINEATKNSTGQADDGPGSFVPNFDVFKRLSISRATKIGYDVIDMIMTKEIEDYYEHPIYPTGPVPAVSYFPAGVIGAKTPMNQVDIYSSGAYTQWYKHITRTASMTGYELVTTQIERDAMQKMRKLATDSAIDAKTLNDEFEKSLNEEIRLPVEIGDTLLMGKWKNKKVVVKTIGEDEHGMPTINGKKVVTFRFGKKGPNIFEKIVELDEMLTITEATDKLKLKIPTDIQRLHKIFKKNGKKLFIVGGAVRDAILGKSPHDFDLATDAKPDEVLFIAKKAGSSTAEVGKSFGVVIVNGHEIATFRKDIGKGRRPDSVDYTDIQGDVKRRDLTINALFYDMDRGEIVDLVGGIKDLQDKRIRTVGRAEERFDEDALRKLRALRFHAKLGGKMDPTIMLALKQDPTLKEVSSERIRDEFIKTLESAQSTKKYVELIDKLGFTKLILPGIKLSKPYIDENDYILFLSYVLRDNDRHQLVRKLNKLNYTDKEIKDIDFLISLQEFDDNKVSAFKKKQKITNLSDEQILKFGKLIGNDFKKFLKFELQVKGNDVPAELKGADIGNWISKKETERFMNEMAKGELAAVEKYADKKLDPVDVAFTKHFFDRVNDPRNGKEISQAELTGFFKRLSKNKKQFVEFLKKYKDIVLTDARTKINIPFILQSNKIIAKTIMRKDDFKVKVPRYKFENVNEQAPERIRGGLADGLELIDIANKHNVDIDELLIQFRAGIKVEMEHTKDPKISAEITKDHLFEDPKYYTKLADMEGEPFNESTEYRPDLVSKSKTWYILDKKDILKISDDVIDLIQTAYRNTPEGSFVNNKSDIARSMFWDTIDVDGEFDVDAVIFGRKTPQGIKIQGLGHDGEAKSKAAVIKRLIKLLKTNGYWVEASDALEHVLYKTNTPFVKSEKVAQSIFPDSNLKMTGDNGKYIRYIGSTQFTETIFGKPKVSVKEDLIDELLTDLDEHLESYILPNIGPITEKKKVTGGTQIPAEHTLSMYNSVESILISTLGISKSDLIPVGSTIKKPKGEYVGDIDIALNGISIGGKHKLKFGEIQTHIYNKIKSKFDNVVNNTGTGVISFLYPIPQSNELGQIDLMMSDDLELTDFVYHSPNFIKGESKYKGLYRSIILLSVIKYIDTDDVDEYYEEGNDKGKLKTYTKHSLTGKTGLIKQLKSYEGKLGRKKNPTTVKGNDVEITKIPTEIVHFVFGDDYSLNDVKSFEDVYDIVTGSNFKHKDKLPKIIKNFKDSIFNLKLPLPTEIKK